MKIQIEKVSGTNEQIDALYSLLLQRIYTISHQKIPAFDDHKHFVLNHPYVDWFILRNAEKPAGSFYVKYDNSIGLNLVDQAPSYLTTIIEYIRTKLKPQSAVPSEVPPYFYINVPHSNIELQKMFEEAKLSPIQISYRL